MRDQRATFERLYDEHIRAVHAYAVRRVEASAADDIVAETFAAAWRRIGELPAPELRLVWLLGIARGHITNSRRGQRRRSALLEKMGTEPAPEQAEPDYGLDPGLHAALNQLGNLDRELLCLIAWERLDPEAARRVLGLTAVGMRVRLHRARKRVRAYLEDTANRPGLVEEPVDKTWREDAL